jgi:hypothetical protein
MSRAWLVLFFVLAPFAARAADVQVQDAQEEELEEVRADVTAQIQLQAYDLLDELVYGWLQQPIFTVDTPVVLADVTVPVGFNSGLQALVENHFVSLITKNPRTHVQLSHCPQCMELVVHSGAKGTVVARGVDEPDALSAAGLASGAKHALFLDFEAEGNALVLRARVTALEPALPIKYAKTLSTTTANAALLRSGDKLKSAADARKEYLDILEGKGLLLVPIRIGVRAYQPGSSATVGTEPFVWLEAGVEAALSQARAWTANIEAGLSWTPQLHVAWMAQGRVARLISGSVSSLTHPDLYFFLGAGVLSVYGRSALMFGGQVPSISDVLSQQGQEANAIVGFWHFGLELRVKNRMSVIGFLESAPVLNSSNLGSFMDLGAVKFHTLGFEVSFCF